MIERSLLEPTGSSVFVFATDWLGGTLLGSLATAIGVIAVAMVGVVMLSGRLHVRQALTIALGCFILFGARAIAQGLMPGMVQTAEASKFETSELSLPHAKAIAPRVTPPSSSDDPYAGAAVRR